MILCSGIVRVGKKNLEGQREIAVMRHLQRFPLQTMVSAWRAVSGGLPERRLLRHAAGFSMVELIITLVLLGIAMAIAIPSFRGWVDNSNLKAAARTLSSDIAYMREAAMSSGRTHTIAYDMAQNRYTLRWDSDGAGTYADVPNYAATRLVSDHGGGIQITSVSQTPIKIISSGAINPFGTVVITNSRGSTATISTLITGRSHVTYSMQ
jgi:prepilin-type N-terminal cleavage/methylation domain-containing protein